MPRKRVDWARFQNHCIRERLEAVHRSRERPFLSSNTVGLHLALVCLRQKYGWSDQDEVISTPLTFVSTNHVILQAGLIPVLADVDESLCLSVASVRARITSRTRALIFVGMGGSVGDYSCVRSLCREKGIAVILDAAHVAGTRVNGHHVGHDADVAVFSFQAVKNLPTANSGMICFAYVVDDERARKLSWLGINRDTYSRTAAQGAYKWMYDVEGVGYKYHGNSIMAAIGLVQLKYLDQDNAYRRQLVTWYVESLAGSNVIVVEHTPTCESARHLFQIRVNNRGTLMMALNEHRICDVRPHVNVLPECHAGKRRNNFATAAYGAFTRRRGSRRRVGAAIRDMNLKHLAADIDPITGLRRIDSRDF